MKKRIVMIEDEGELLMLVKNYLEKREFSVQCCMNGKEGIETVKREKPDIVLLDLKLPDISGMDVYAQLRLDKQTEKIPIVFVTASTMIADIEKGFRVGVDEYICKPVELEHLYIKIKKVLNI
ncbi:MAG: response regulator [Candidatus Omnitrophota bacterium]